MGKGIFNPANCVTFIGIVLVVWLNLLIWDEPVSNHQLIFFLALGIWASDLLDGYLARSLKMETNFGDCLDKIRDKLFSIPIFIYVLLKMQPGSFKILIFLVIVVEIFTVVIWILGTINNLKLDISWFGKIKISCHFIFISLWFLKEWHAPWQEISYFYPVLLFLIIVATISGILNIFFTRLNPKIKA